jgi:YD repeat-containing protein
MNNKNGNRTKETKVSVGTTEGKKTVTTKYTYDGAGNRVNTKVESNGSVTRIQPMQ